MNIIHNVFHHHHHNVPALPFLGGMFCNHPPMQSGAGLNKLTNALNKLADALNQLAKGLDKGNAQNPTGPSSTPVGTGSGSGSTTGAGDAPIAGKGRIWGDPHFIGADGGKFDVQGKAGKTYNLLSDKGIQINGRFDKFGSGGATVVGQVGMTIGTDVVRIEKNGDVSINGEPLKNGQTVTLDNGSTVTKNGRDVAIKTNEWKVDVQTRGNHINMDVSTKNAIADGVRPHGLLGQTFDGDGKARNGDKGMGAQGGGAIEDVNGNIIAQGDKSTVEDYEVDDLFDTGFKNHNHNSEGEAGYMAGYEAVKHGFMTLGVSLAYNRMM